MSDVAWDVAAFDHAKPLRRGAGGRAADVMLAPRRIAAHTSGLDFDRNRPNSPSIG